MSEKIIAVSAINQEFLTISGDIEISFEQKTELCAEAYFQYMKDSFKFDDEELELLIQIEEDNRRKIGSVKRYNVIIVKHYLFPSLVFQIALNNKE